MPYNPFDPKYDDLPEVIPIFPLEGALLLPRGELPLNIFEPRYVAMVQDVLKTNRLIGMIQPNYKIGCVGRIVRFEETADGRYMIALRGLCRFWLGQDIEQSAGGYRRAGVSFDGYKNVWCGRDVLISTKIRSKHSSVTISNPKGYQWIGTY